MRWIVAVQEITQGQVIAVDGKTVRRSHDRAVGKDAIHRVSAWATANGVVLGQVKTADHSNEITAIPKLLALLDISGCMVTLDAAGCQREIARQIIQQGGDYVLVVKRNQGHLYADLQDWFAYAHQTGFADMAHDYVKAVNKGHGRIEIRECWTIDDPDAFAYIRQHLGWQGLCTIAMVKRQRLIGDHRSEEIAYFISSLDSDVARILACTRKHWGVENSLHWVLDVVFREDDSRIRTDHAPQNMTVLRHIALSLLKRDQSVRGSIKNKRFRAALDEDYLFSVLTSV